MLDHNPKPDGETEDAARYFDLTLGGAPLVIDGNIKLYVSERRGWNTAIKLKIDAPKSVKICRTERGTHGT